MLGILIDSRASAITSPSTSVVNIISIVVEGAPPIFGLYLFQTFRLSSLSFLFYSFSATFSATHFPLSIASKISFLYSIVNS